MVRINYSPTWGSFAPIQANLTECLLSDIVENAVSFPYQLEEPEPYIVAGVKREDLENDPHVGPLMKSEEEAGNKTNFFQAHSASPKLREGYEYLRVGRAKIMYRSKTLAHGDELVLMVKRGR